METEVKRTDAEMLEAKLSSLLEEYLYVSAQLQDMGKYPPQKVRAPERTLTIAEYLQYEQEREIADQAIEQWETRNLALKNDLHRVEGDLLLHAPEDIWIFVPAFGVLHEVWVSRDSYSGVRVEIKFPYATPERRFSNLAS
jgi:hypothetical protein